MKIEDLKRGVVVMVPGKEGSMDLAKFQSRVKGNREECNVKILSGDLEGKIVRVPVLSVLQASTYRRGSKPSGGRQIRLGCMHIETEHAEAEPYILRGSAMQLDRGLPLCPICGLKMERDDESEGQIGLNYGRGGTPIEERDNPAPSQRRIDKGD